MPSGGDRQFASLAVEKGFMTATQMKEALSEYSRLEKDKVQVSIDRLMLDKGFLTAAEIEEIQNIQQRRISICPCGNRMNVFKYKAGTIVKCSACLKPFRVPSFRSEIGASKSNPDAVATRAPFGFPKQARRAGDTPSPGPAKLPSLEISSSWWRGKESGFAPGHRIGRYEVLDVIGAGGMGVVYKVRHTLLDRIDALKVVRPDVASRKEYRKYFLREARISARLKHPNLTQVYDIIDDGPVLAFSMQYVEGMPLSKIIGDVLIEVGQALEWTSQIAQALILLHAEGLVHRDIKPSNILIDSGSKAILTDFGFAKNFEEAGTSGVTCDDVPMGTPGFMAPEQIDNARFVDQRADIYSLGSTLFAMLSGSAPYTGSTPVEIFGKVLASDPPRLSMVVDGVPEEVEALVDDMIAKDRERRIRNPKNVCDRIKTILESINRTSPG